MLCLKSFIIGLCNRINSRRPVIFLSEPFLFHLFILISLIFKIVVGHGSFKFRIDNIDLYIFGVFCSLLEFCTGEIHVMCYLRKNR